MMAVLGFLVLMIIGGLLLAIGITFTYASTQIGDKPTAWPLILSVIGGTVVYWAWSNAPFVVTLTGAAS